MLFVFAALIAMVVGQCDVSGQTYTFENSDGTVSSLTFGVEVDGWQPGLVDWGNGEVYYASWSKATATRWETQFFGASTGEWCEQTGNYDFFFNDGCAKLTLSIVHDRCQDRINLFANEFTLLEQVGDCTSAGSSLTTKFSESATWSRISGDDATYVFGIGEYAVISVATRAAIVQRWRSADANVLEVVDLASWPQGYACPTTEKGQYFHVADFDESCGFRICGTTDACRGRAELLHNAAFNGFESDVCGNDVIIPTNGRPTSCSDGRQWLRYPMDCVNQDVEGGCAYCKGIAMGEQTAWCISREGAGCEDIFESAPSRTFCNLEFECPASTASASIVVFICSLLALFLH